LSPDERERNCCLHSDFLTCLFAMPSDQFDLDSTWRILCSQLAAAQQRAANAEANAIARSYTGGTKEALERAEAEISAAEQALAKHEETISDARWGSW
jgi:hypothetical protein